MFTDADADADAGLWTSVINQGRQQRQDHKMELRTLANLAQVLYADRGEATRAIITWKQCLVLAGSGDQDKEMRRKVLNAITIASMQRGRWDDARHFCEQHLSLATDQQNVLTLQHRAESIDHKAAAEPGNT